MPIGTAESPTPKGQNHAAESSKWQKLIAWLNCVWEIFQDLGEVLALCRFSLAVVLVAGLALAFSDQGQDLLVAVAEGSAVPWTLLVFVWLWAYSAWYWARAILAHGAPIPTDTCCRKPIFGRRKDRVRWLVSYAPRIIGASAFIMILYAQWQASRIRGLNPSTEDRLWVQVACVAIEGVVFFIVFVWRRWTCKVLKEFLRARGIKAPRLLDIEETPAYRRARSVRHLPANVHVHGLIFAGGSSRRDCR